jgi:hypothetical protein
MENTQIDWDNLPYGYIEYSELTTYRVPLKREMTVDENEEMESIYDLHLDLVNHDERTETMNEAEHKVTFVGLKLVSDNE